MKQVKKYFIGWIIGDYTKETALMQAYKLNYGNCLTVQATKHKGYFRIFEIQ